MAALLQSLYNVSHAQDWQESKHSFAHNKKSAGVLDVLILTTVRTMTITGIIIFAYEQHKAEAEAPAYVMSLSSFLYHEIAIDSIYCVLRINATMSAGNSQTLQHSTRLTTQESLSKISLRSAAQHLF